MKEASVILERSTALVETLPLVMRRCILWVRYSATAATR
jgi:hypothetical protein